MPLILLLWHQILRSYFKFTCSFFCKSSAMIFNMITIIVFWVQCSSTIPFIIVPVYLCQHNPNFLSPSNTNAFLLHQCGSRFILYWDNIWFKEYKRFCLEIQCYHTNCQVSNIQSPQSIRAPCLRHPSSHVTSGSVYNIFFSLLLYFFYVAHIIRLFIFIGYFI